MQHWHGYEATPTGWGRSVATIGMFDGVHRGHQALIGQAVERARHLGLRSVVVTFDPHPAAVARPGSYPAILTHLERKAELIAALGADGLCVIPFTPEFSRLPAEEFVRDVLVGHLRAAWVVVGENFRFGHRAAGDVALLDRLGRTFRVEGAPLVVADRTTFSSTYVRSCLAAGDVAGAAAALGRPHRIEGILAPSGRANCHPTAVLRCDPRAAMPADGVYAARLAGPSENLPAVVSIDTRSDLSGPERRIEVRLPDVGGHLHGERLGLDFVARLRQTTQRGAVGSPIHQSGQDAVGMRAVLS
ncbi:bifunctional riboflavin kinase/FMN adenylyltransferase [Planosporangium mesophilum]|uniref:Riboflavin biosynthesis protein n=1 Tax=Planosporangium mesophilum TaxID=689768 RepID=A0A8J3X1F8_9ACTN|nr:riboflavin kinase [Planosporangium mesophilum]NJC86292.1 bifunctional riboflavin kinase/FAD synthetase [Planosporangium mesophilum]GII23299.1 riboflavin biosynthesis protein [Planosporangium mesophilum]